ncbi:MAG: hypothetical protein QGH15_14275 [Kiritimatiellia bacterium]|jgi:hypothetical protein|nr:hypothetical protein [Kiritimatiellia bacterium]
MKSLTILFATTSLALNAAGGEIFSAGRPAGLESRDAGLRLRAGALFEFEGMVEETTRSFYDVTGQSYKQEDAETYDSDDFGMEDGYPMIGLSFENGARFLTFQFDFMLMNPDTEAVAKRNYYIGVSEVEFDGVEYDHMKIEEGVPFSLDFFGGTVEMRGLFTPFTFSPSPSMQISPFLDLGLFMFLGYYDIDAGEATGIVQYQEPPEDFVVGGQADGFIGAGLPELGLGCEIRMGQPDDVNFVLQGHYSVCQYDGSSKYLTTSSGRDKDVDIDHVNARLRCSVEFPMQSGRCVTLGVEYQLIDMDVAITSQSDTEEEIIENRERFDKFAELKMQYAAAMLGLTF